MVDLPRHGGALDAAIAADGGTRGDWLDLSTGINPNGWPVPPIDGDLWRHLPDMALENACLDAARAYYRVPDDAAIVAAPGTQAIIQHLPSLVDVRRRIGIVGPTYNEYGHCLARTGADVAELDHLPRDGFDCVVFGNPNNPDGRAVGAGHDRAAIDALRRSGAGLIADEAFADVDPGVSLVPQCGSDGLLVLRSFGKFFGLAGARLGFAIGSPGDIVRLRTLLGPWAVPGPALFIGARAMRDAAWIAETRSRLAGDRRRLVGLLEGHGFSVIGHTDLFVLASHDRVLAVRQGLGRSHILVRAFAGRPDWLRFGLPSGEAGFERLDTALSQVV